MNSIEFISIDELCSHYEIETSFFSSLNEYGLVEIISVQSASCIHKNKISDVEKIIRLHKDLAINFEGIDTVLNLLNKIETLQDELVETRNRLRIYEE